MAHYVMEDPREASRLAAKVDAKAWSLSYVLPNVRANASILSVGCGPATIEREIGKADPSFTVTAVDASTERCAAARQTIRSSANVRVVQADALALPFPTDSFDFVYTRFLLQHVGRPYDAIAEMVRVCRPGGKVLFHDLDGQLLWHFPESEEFGESIRVVTSALAGDGFDPYVGRKLYTYAYRAGLVGLNARIEPYHTIFGAADEQTRSLWELKLDIARPKIIQILGPEKAGNLIRCFLAHLQDPESITYSVAFTVVGVKP
jgi:ubiquinone/menaquinone biosynthesis C-methylase UbiE